MLSLAGGLPRFATPRHIGITGASSGIGAALALHYAAPDVTLALLARDAGRLEAVAGACRAKGAQVHVTLADVTSSMAMAEWIMRCESRMPLDLLLANAGLGGMAALSGGAGETAAATARLFAVNLQGVANSVAPLLPAMIRRGTGQIAIIGSLAGMLGLPQSPSYSASKAAVATYGDALRRLAAPAGVAVSVVYPGFVNTPMSRGVPYRRLFLWDADRAARYIARRLSRGHGQIAFPWPMVALARFGRLLPYRWIDALLKRTVRRTP
jgi:short-subunit dehydrogenase